MLEDIVVSYYSGGDGAKRGRELERIGEKDASTRSSSP